MAAPPAARSFAAMRTLLLTLAGLYVAGIALAVGGDLAPLGTAIASGSRLNAPLPIIAAQLLGGCLLLRGRRPGAALLVAACALSLAAAVFDGDVGAAGLSTAQVGYQLLIAAATAATLLASLRWRAPSRAAR
jgi:hypothetical protein